MAPGVVAVFVPQPSRRGEQAAPKPGGRGRWQVWTPVHPQHLHLVPKSGYRLL